MDDKVGFVVEIPECFCQKTKVTMPEKLVGADGEVGVEKDSHLQSVYVKPFA